MLRRVTEALTEDTEVRKQFVALPDPHVFEKEHVCGEGIPCVSPSS